MTNEQRYLLTIALIKRLGYAGKIQLQKLIYFLQEQLGLELGYVFRMHHYGPYSEDLDDDLSILKAGGYISITPDDQGYGFHIKAEEQPEKEWGSLPKEMLERVAQIVTLFQEYDSSALELRATIHFVQKRLIAKPKEDVVSLVRELKPRFTDSQIGAAYDELLSEEFLPAI